MRFYIFVLALFIQNILLSAETEIQPRSRLFLLKPLLESEQLQLPALDKSKILKASKSLVSFNGKESIRRPFQIAQPTAINQSIKQMGLWQEINGETIWRLDISAKEALHLNLGFKNVFFPDSAILFVTDKVTGKVIQQYSAKDNKDHGQLWTPILDTQDLQLELNISSTEVDKLTLNFTQVAQGYISLKSNVNATKSGSCNINVDCQRIEWGNEIRSVARYMISGSYLCTGTLVNNTREDREPLFLTAAHCEVSEITAPSMVFYWNYETSVCEGVADGSLDQEQTGATLVSRWEGIQENVLSNSDFALVRLDDMPADSANVFYAGWDNQDKTYVGSTTIHHPSGDEKRISQDVDVQSITHFGGEAIDSGRFLKIGEWEDGTTEGGSSGAGLWNSNQHVVGTLSGGDASCVNSGLSDWYGRFASHWLGNSYKSNQLAAHLAPNISNIITLDGIDSCLSPTVSINVGTDSPVVGEQISFTSTVSNGSGSYIYEWDFNNDGVVDSPDANPAYTYSAASNHTVNLVVRDSECPGIAKTRVLVPDVSEVFLADGVLPSGYTKTDSAEGSWVVDDSNSSEGLFSLKSQIVNFDETSSIELSANYESGTISFDYRVSSEDTFDFFKFYIDDVEKINLSGEHEWTAVSYPVSAGSHVLRWAFVKDGGISGGQDASWIDNLQFHVDPPPPVIPPSSSGGSSDFAIVGLLFLSLNFRRKG